jgi:hypothetical protein
MPVWTSRARPKRWSVCKSAEPERAVEIGANLAGIGAEVEQAIQCVLDNRAVDAGQSLGGDLRPQLLAQLQVGFGPQLQRRSFLGAQAHAVGDVILRPLEVAQMRAASAVVADNPCLDHDSPLSSFGTPLRRLPLEPIGGGLTPPIREHLPFLGAPPRRVAPLSREGVSGPPFAFAAAFSTWATKDCERRALRRPRSRIRPGRGRKSEASSGCMPEASSCARRRARSNRRLSYNRLQKQALGMLSAICPSAVTRKSVCRQTFMRKRNFL